MMIGCPVCSSAESISVINIPAVPVHCNLLWDTRQEAEKTAYGTIDLRFCPACGHLFNQAYDAGVMQYSEQYENSLHFSPVFQSYTENLVRSLVERRKIYDKDILEIGCGDGSFLDLVCSVGGNRGTGFDPSYTGGLDGKKHLRFIRDFYSEKYSGLAADLIICRQVIEHLAEPNLLLRLIRKSSVGRGALVFVDVPNGRFMLKQFGIWDLIYEHPSYFTPASIVGLFRQNGLGVLVLNETFGDQFLTLEAAWEQESAHFTVASSPEALLHDVNVFRQHYQKKISKWQSLLEAMKADNITVVLWGAGSKGVSFLNMLSAAAHIQYVIDLNPRKWGKYITGSGQIIQPPEILKSVRPDAVIITNKNYRSEIAALLSDMNLAADILIA